MPNKEEITNGQQQQQQQQQPFDMAAMMASAQQIVKGLGIDGDKNPKDLDMGKLLGGVADAVFNNFEKNGAKIDQSTKDQMKLMTKVFMNDSLEGSTGHIPNEDSKINFNTDDTKPKASVGSVETEKTEKTEKTDKLPKPDNLFEEIDSDEEEVDIFRPIAKDLYYDLQVSLEEAYTGKIKKLLVSRKRLNRSGKVIPEKRKIEVVVQPGMVHGQEIRFNKEGDEKYGFRSGDIIITLVINSHPEYERVDNTLCYVKNISLYESYAAAKGLVKLVIKHLDGSYMVCNICDGKPLHTMDGTRKIRNAGMPFMNKEKKLEYGDLFVRFNLILPESFEGDDNLETIEKLFPVLPGNQELLLHSFGRSSDFTPLDKKINDVLLEEVTLTDMEKLEREAESESESDSESGSDSRDGSDDYDVD